MLHTMSKGASAWYTPQIDGHTKVETLVWYLVVPYCLQLLSSSGWRLMQDCCSFASILGSRYASLVQDSARFSCRTACADETRRAPGRFGIAVATCVDVPRTL